MPVGSTAAAVIRTATMLVLLAASGVAAGAAAPESVTVSVIMVD
jgi:hypothetical protein